MVTSVVVCCWGAVASATRQHLRMLLPAGGRVNDISLQRSRHRTAPSSWNFQAARMSAADRQQSIVNENSVTKIMLQTAQIAGSDPRKAMEITPSSAPSAWYWPAIGRDRRSRISRKAA